MDGKKKGKGKGSDKKVKKGKESKGKDDARDSFQAYFLTAQSQSLDMNSPAGEIQTMLTAAAQFQMLRCDCDTL